MYKLYPLLLLLILLASCETDNGNETLVELKAIRQEVSSLSDSISVLKDSLQVLKKGDVKDTVIVDTTIKLTQTKVIPPAKEKPRPTTKPTKKPVSPKPANETILHKYVNGVVSVEITPWANDERDVILYDLYGQETIRMEEVRHSYTIRIDLEFAPNGSVSKAVVHTNPGASMYWYESEITFDTTNGPTGKIDHQYPQSLDDIMNEKWQYWDKKTKTWKVQEVME
jgi:hypothetical protein